MKKYLLFIMLITTSIISSPSTHAAESKFIHTNSTQIVDGDNKDIFFTGMNLGNWLLWEGYLMMGDFEYRTHTQFLNSMAVAFGNDMVKAKEFEHQWRMNYVTEKAISDLKDLGFNSVRLPFHYDLFWDGSNVKDDGFQYFDRLVEFCKDKGIYILLDMHAAPGYQNPGDHCDNVNSSASQPRESVKFWDGDNVEIASKVWKHIATKYKDEPTIWGYDLINEPVPQVKDEWKLLKSLQTMRNAIREVDNNHIIVAEGAWWGAWMDPLDWRDADTQASSGISARWDNNMVYQTHHYSTDVSQLVDRLALCDTLEVPMILGEYGESDMTNLRKMTDWCINNNVDYFPWSFKKMSHDKCLWTIQPNEAYEELKTAISSNAVGPENLYDNMIEFCKNNIANGADALVWDQSFYDAVKDPNPPCEVDEPINFKVSKITKNSVTLSWTDGSNETGYDMSCSNGKKVALDADVVTYTFTALDEFTDYKFYINAFDAECSSSDVEVSAKTLCGGDQNPYNGATVTIPGIIEAEDYDEGCESYNELSVGNSGEKYRTDDVDITQGNNGFAIGWIENGEWLEYTVHIESDAEYDIEYVVATEVSGEIKLILNDLTKAVMSVPRTGGWAEYDTLAVNNIALPPGKQVIRVLFRGQFNLDKLLFKKSEVTTSSKIVEFTPELISLYPNPAKNVVNIISKTEGKISMYDMAGNFIKEVTSKKVDTSNLRSGIYFIVIKDKKVQAIKSFYVKR